MTDISVEFLESNGFRLKPFPDGNFWVRRYTEWYLLQVSEDLKEFTEEDDCFVTELTSQEFIDTITTHDKAINE